MSLFKVYDLRGMNKKRAFYTAERVDSVFFSCKNLFFPFFSEKFFSKQNQA